VRILATDAFETLYREEYAPMVRLAYLLVGSAETAEEVVQDSFLRVRDRVAAVERPGAYLRRTVVNGCRNQHRHRDVERRGFARLARVDWAEPELDHLADALAALPPRQRAVLVLRYYLDCTELEIAEALGCRPGTVKSLASRGLASLREVL
jgi:RNA polymerase sigma-70 factor (sigma-E family)